MKSIINKFLGTGAVACGFLRTVWDLLNFTFDVKGLSEQSAGTVAAVTVTASLLYGTVKLIEKARRGR